MRKQGLRNSRPPHQKDPLSSLCASEQAAAVLAYTMGLTYLSDDEQEALLRAAQVCAAFSLMGSVFICVCYFRFPRLRKLSFTLVLWLAIADIGE